MKIFNSKITAAVVLACLLGTQPLSAQNWLKTGNPGVLATDYLGTQNNVPLNFKVFATNAGTISSGGPTFLGYQAGNVNTGASNAGVGYQALLSNSTGYGNSALGYQALRSNTTGTYNSAFGIWSLQANSTGQQNLGLGINSLYSNTTGSFNVSTGNNALVNNTIGSSNAAVGYAAMLNNASGNWNAAMGANALYDNTTGELNTAMGPSALAGNTTGSRNTGVGYGSLTSVGNLTSATAIGEQSVVNASNKVRLGSATVTVVEGQVAYTFPSDGRFKFNVTEDVKGLDFITRLRPVVYNFDTRKFDEFLTQNLPDSMRQAHLAGVDYAPSTAVRQTGFIAQEVEQAAKEIGYDFNGVHVPIDANDNYSVAYSQFVMPLVKSVQELNATNIALQARLDAQEALIQKLLAQTGQGTDMKADRPSLGQNVPNPAQGDATVAYYIPAHMGCGDAQCMIVVHDMSGRRVHTVPVSAGNSTVTLPVSKFQDGVYTYQLVVNNSVVATQKLVVAK